MSAAPTVVRTRRVARFLTRVPLVLSKHLWIWPLLGAILISLVGLWTRSLVEGTLKAELANRLQTLLNADVAALRLWFSEREADARALGADARVHQAIVELWALEEAGAGARRLIEAPAAESLRSALAPILESQRYLDYMVVGADKRVLAASRALQVGQPAPGYHEPLIRRALEARISVSRPVRAQGSPAERAEGTTILVAAPVLATNDAAIAVLGLRLRPEEQFANIFSVVRMGETGEAYAFDRRGVMLTDSRFSAALRSLGLATNETAAAAAADLELLDPGESEDRKGSSQKPPSQPRLTRMAAAATKGLDGYDVEGYRNYRGVKVVGAWAWLPEYNIGVATEVAAEEAFQTLYILRRVFFSLFLLLVLSGLAIFAFSLLLERLQASVRKTALAARRLGQYALLQEIGRGANSMVYRARHTLLRRPVAVKLLSPDMTDAANVARFEHEVQMTSQLTHPNTVAVYDYGRTPEGLFYYAMEYLSGIDLHRLIREFGPQPEERVIHILRQVCGSLAEAHRIGLIHRDIKPANIFLTRRAGVCDMVKVLDFGMVKAVHLMPQGMAANAVVGTPHYMSPEAIEKPETVDARSDLYSLGAVGYWLLTGKTLFSGSVDELLSHQVKQEPRPISAWLKNGTATDLHRVLMRCLAKEPADRPGSAVFLDEALAGCACGGAWTSEEAEKWWRQNMGGVEVVPAATMPEKTLVIGPRT